MRLVALASLPLLLSINFSQGQTAQAWDIVINEVLPDPSPPQSLPNNEFIELKNVSSTSINLRNWKISDGSSTATINSSIILEKDSFLILCPSSALNSFQNLGRTVGLANFPSLNNDADIITLYSAEGRVIHSIGYTIEWFHGSIKSEGGWSLEMIDDNNPCGEFNNWKPSEDRSGGTPGKQNSIASTNIDEDLPVLLRAYSPDPFSLIAVFNESLDSSSLVFSEFLIEGRTVRSVTAIAPLFKELKLSLTDSLKTNEVITLTVKKISDCAGNQVGSFNKAKAGRPGQADSMDIVINEILFNPPSDGYDYIELYNRSNKILDLDDLVLSSIGSTGSITRSTALSSTDWLFFPGEFLAFSTNTTWVSKNYTVKAPESILQINDMISLPDDKGHFGIFNRSGKRIDAVQYQQQWHFPLLSTKEGVSLERINANGISQDPGNWTSASGDAGFGTPGYTNSQTAGTQALKGGVTVEPKVFSPNFDGRDDFAFIRYQFEQPGFIASVTIYDGNGRLVRTLEYNQRLSETGQWRWDGLNDFSYPLGAGIYIISIDLFDLKGNRRKIKTPVVIAKTTK